METRLLRLLRKPQICIIFWSKLIRKASPRDLSVTKNKLWKNGNIMQHHKHMDMKEKLRKHILRYKQPISYTPIS